MKKCRDFEEMIDYITERIIEEEDITCVLSLESLSGVIDKLNNYVHYEVKNFVTEYKIEDKLFMLTKITSDINNEVILILEALYDKAEDELVAEIKDVYGKVVILEEGVISDEDKKLIAFDNEFVEIGVDNKNKTCICEDAPEIEILKLYTELVTTLGCNQCVFNTLKSLYDFAYNEGSKDQLIKINNDITKQLLQREDY